MRKYKIHYFAFYIVATVCLFCFLAGCSDEVIMESSVDVGGRSVEVNGNMATLEVPVSTRNFEILDGYVELSKNENFSNSTKIPLEVWTMTSTDIKEFEVTFDNLEYSTTYYYRVVLSGFVGNDDYTGEETSTFKFKSYEFKTEGVSYVINTSGFVDLGLSVKWFAKNLGAPVNVDAGIRAGWGDPTGVLSSDNEADYGGGLYPSSNISGSQYDICTSMLGSSYRLPTHAEFNELLEKCSWVFTNYRGVAGWIVIGSTGNAIFLPGTDDDGAYIPYWSATFSTGNNKPVFLALYNGKVNEPKCYAANRNSKAYFRPVGN